MTDLHRICDDDLCATIEYRSGNRWDGHLTIELVRRYREMLTRDRMHSSVRKHRAPLRVVLTIDDGMAITRDMLQEAFGGLKKL